MLLSCTLIIISILKCEAILKLNHSIKIVCLVAGVSGQSVTIGMSPTLYLHASKIAVSSSTFKGLVLVDNFERETFIRTYEFTPYLNTYRISKGIQPHTNLVIGMFFLPRSKVVLLSYVDSILFMRVYLKVGQRKAYTSYKCRSFCLLNKFKAFKVLSVTLLNTYLFTLCIVYTNKYLLIYTSILFGLQYLCCV